MKTISVKVQGDHLQRLAAAKSPIAALSELIWNSLDADAIDVKVIIDRNLMGGISSLRVIDNGHGLPYEDATLAFEKLGGSWKRHQDKTRSGRMLHGKQGKGRFQAFALGENVEWTTCFKSNGHLLEYTIQGRRQTLQDFDFAETKASSNDEAGTIVTITEVDRSPGAFDSPRAVQSLTEEFALYLRQYTGVRIYYDGTEIKPSTAERKVSDFQLPKLTLEDGRQIDAWLTIIEWVNSAERALYLCDANGFSLSKIPPGIQAPGFNFTAYLKSSFIRELDDKGNLVLDELLPDLRNLISSARDQMKEYFRKRIAEEAIELVQQWKHEEIYPYEGIPETPIEQAERQVFDILALNVYQYLPDFESSAAKSKRLAFRLLKEALETSPQTLQLILQEVLVLPPEKLEELATLLKRTSLEAIINASKMVANRLNFLEGLELLVFDPEIKGKVLERRHLHKIIADETWIFGEEFNLTLSDKSLI